METTYKIKIEPALKALIPPLSKEELQQLESNLIENGGARDALIVWPRGSCAVLLDGHNRYEICTRLGLEYRVQELHFDSNEEAADWMDKNQLGRRNLDPRQMSLLRGRRYNRIKKPQGGTGANRYLQSGQNVHFVKTAQGLAEEHGINEKTIRRDGAFAEAVEKLGIEREVVAGEIEAPKWEIVGIANSLPEKPTRDELSKAVEAVKSRPHVANNSGDNEWYTPEEYVEAARRVLGKINLDPASNPTANEIVQAEVFYTAEDDGLAQEWKGNVWMNPPYESGLVGQFAEKLCGHHQAGDVPAAIVLVNNATETKWFQMLAGKASAVCFPKGRVKFWHPNKANAAPLQGQALLFFGENSAVFVGTFRAFGFSTEVK